MWAAEPSVIHTPMEPLSEVGCCREELETDLPHRHPLCPWVSLAMLEVIVKCPRAEGKLGGGSGGPAPCARREEGRATTKQGAVG